MAVPSDIATLYAWYKADAITGLADGALLAPWPDSSGNGFVTEQPFNFKPTYETTEINGLPVVRFGAGGDKVLRTGNLASLPSTTIFAVLRPASLTGVQAIRAPDSGGLLLRLTAGKPELVKSGAALIGAGATTLTVGQPSLITATYVDTTSWALYLNGGLDAAGTHVQTLTTGGTYSFIGGGGLFGGLALLADLAELIVYSSALGATDRGLVTEHLIAKWAITAAAATKAALPSRRIDRHRPLIVR